MRLTDEEKQKIKRELAQRLGPEHEVRMVVVFGSFLTSDDPHDLDVAVFQDSDETYLPLAMKYRRLTREIARRIPMDIVPLKAETREGWFWREVMTGEVVYER